jgi:hypothetical protein
MNEGRSAAVHAPSLFAAIQPRYRHHGGYPDHDGLRGGEADESFLLFSATMNRMPVSGPST